MDEFWNFDIDAEGIAWLCFDTPGASANVLSTPALQELDRQLVAVAHRHPSGLVIYSGKDKGFIAGADVKAFAEIPGIDAAESIIRTAHNIFARLENLPVPTVALLNGYCLGGGLELALACRYRIASDEPDTRIGFPETRLGIFPGFGGTVRATRLIGHLPALQLMLTNRNLGGKAAKRLGLVDEAVPRRQLRSAARHYLGRRPPRRHAPPLQRIPGWASLRPFVGAWLKRRVALKADSEHYPAPFMLVDHWRRHANQPVAMYDGEMHDVARLLNGRTGRNLVRVFMLQEMLKGQVAAPFTGQRVHVIGGGVMGGDIAAWCALRGLRVTLQDRTAEQLGPAFERAHALFARRLKDAHRVRTAMDRLVPDLEGRAVSRADVVIEAIFEDAAVKQELYRELEPRLAESALLATNTSSIPLEILGEGLEDPHRLVGLHFFNPVARMPLVEVVCTAETPADMRERALGFARRIDKLPLVVKSSPGFLVNRILVPYLLEAVAMVNEGLPAPLVDRAAVTFGMPVGPVELADRVGLDICLAVAEKLAAPLDIEVPEQLRKKVAAGELGRKSGEGFYPWRDGRPRKPNVRQPEVNLQTLQDRLILRMLNEALGCWRDGIVESQDQLDAGVIFGTGFAPFRGGPLHYVRQAGLIGIRDRLNDLESRFGVRFSPDPGWGAL